jgi:uncharacterized protein
MQIPIDSLTPEILRRVVEEYVSRDGTDWSEMNDRILQVLALLETGRAELHFDADTESTNILPAEGHRSD